MICLMRRETLRRAIAMIDEMNDSKIYKRLSGGMKSNIGIIVGFSIVLVIVLAVMTAIVLMIISRIGMMSGEMHIDMTPMMAVPCAIFAIVIIINIVIVVKQVKNSSREMKKRRELCESMSASEFYELDRQMEQSDMYCETFYFLDEYLYAPGARLLIRYSDIKAFRLWFSHRDRHRTGANLVIEDEEGLARSVRVMRWRELEQNYDDFSYRLNEKIEQHTR